MKSNIVNYLENFHPAALNFWQQGTSLPAEISSEALSDVVYSLNLLGLADTIDHRAVDLYVDYLKSVDLPGWKSREGVNRLSVHNCAYAFGTLNLLEEQPKQLYERVLEGRTMELGQIVDPGSKRPVFPRKWAHHNWRVSHWIGGIPSILLSLARSGATGTEPFKAVVESNRDATDSLIDRKTGLLRAYNSNLIQAGFRLLYAIRHDPALGDVGGIAHITWQDHATGRPYVGAEPLTDNARALFYRHEPFMEKVPYCLDFDIVQIVRTGAEQLGQAVATDRDRALKMMDEMRRFFAGDFSSNYTLHKVPGALATYHECGMLAGDTMLPDLGIAPIDIIKRAYWI